VLRALVDTGFYGDLITLSELVEATGITFKHEKLRRLPDGRVARVRFGGGEIQVEDSITYGDVEVW
jgi:predicted aspartyl protease